MIKVTILEGNIDNNLLPEIIFVMTQVKNIRPTYVLKSENVHYVLFSTLLDVNYLQVFRSIVYILIHKKE